MSEIKISIKPAKLYNEEDDRIKVICPPYCPDCYKLLLIEKCEYCGYQSLMTYILPSERQWDITNGLEKKLKQYQAIRLMGKYVGKDKEIIRRFNHVQILFVGRYPKFTFEYLSGYDKLKYLQVYNNPIHHLENINLIKNLEFLDLLDCRKLVDLSALSENKTIKGLVISICRQLQEYDPIGKMQQLAKLQISEGKIASLNFLKSLKNLKELSIAAIKIEDKDLSPLMELNNVEEMWLKITSVRKKHYEEIREALPNCKVITW